MVRFHYTLPIWKLNLEWSGHCLENRGSGEQPRLAFDPSGFRQFMKDDLIFRLRKRAEIRRNIATRKSVQEGQPDRIADLLDEAALALEELQAQVPKKDNCG